MEGSTFWKDRPATAITIGVVAAAGGVFNVWGAFYVFAGFGSYVMAVIVAAVEVLGYLTLRHIVEDWSNNHRFKPGFAAVLFAGIVVLCVMSGHRAFEIMDAEMAYDTKVQTARAERLQTLADKRLAEAVAATDDAAEARYLARYEREQAVVDKIRLEIDKRQPMPGWLMWVFLGVIEGLKIGGLYALATTTSKTWTLRRRRMQALADKAKLHEAKTNVVALKTAARQ